jgi:hypothetical protein
MKAVSWYTGTGGTTCYLGFVAGQGGGILFGLRFQLLKGGS